MWRAAAIHYETDMYKKALIYWSFTCTWLTALLDVVLSQQMCRHFWTKLSIACIRKITVTIQFRILRLRYSGMWRRAFGKMHGYQLYIYIYIYIYIKSLWLLNMKMIHWPTTAFYLLIIGLAGDVGLPAQIRIFVIHQWNSSNPAKIISLFFFPWRNSR